MKLHLVGLALLLCAASIFADNKPSVTELQQRRQRAISAFHDGLLLIHAPSQLSWTTDGFRQDPFFYYFTGLENTPGAILALDGTSGESWLFLPDRVPFANGMTPEVSTSSASSGTTAIEHVLVWSELEEFLAARASEPRPLYFVADPFAIPTLPPAMQPSVKNGPVPLWIAHIVEKWPKFRPADAYDRLHSLTAIESASELAASREAAKATVKAFFAGLSAVRPGASQRAVEIAVEKACWDAGAHGSSFWPWAMTGPNAVFPRPMWSVVRYDHLNSTLQAGELIRFDIGCEWAHYGGDLGRTLPVSGRYTPEQREIWNMLVDAYRAAVRVLREGTTEDQVFAAWRDELLRHRDSVKSPLAKRAIDSWVERSKVPHWQIHTMNFDAGSVGGILRAGMVIDFEPIVSIDQLGFYLEDMFLITKDGAEDITPGIPFTADEIEAAMKDSHK
jgi:Xaa-Pro aminopeptidase